MPNPSLLNQLSSSHPLQPQHPSSTLTLPLQSPSSIPLASELPTLLEPKPDPNRVDWTEDDPQNPKNWSIRHKWILTIICGLLTLNAYVISLSSTTTPPPHPSLDFEFNKQNSIPKIVKHILKHGFQSWLTCLYLSIYLNTVHDIHSTFASSAPSSATTAISKKFDVPVEVATLVTSLFLAGYVAG